jgi:deoxyribodipyrimidine photo-lyase
MKKIGLVLFTSDLRLHDNETLVRAIQENDAIIPLFCLDEVHHDSLQFGFQRMGNLRKQFLSSVIVDLDEQFKALNGYLLIKKGNQLDTISSLIQHVTISKVYTKKQVGFEEKQANKALREFLLHKHIDFEEFSTSTVYHPSDLPFSVSSIPDVFTKFRKIVEKETLVRNPLPSPKNISCHPLPNELFEKSIGYVEEIVGDTRSSLPILGGERKALNHLHKYLFQHQAILHYKETRNELSGIDFSSKFSPWLALGCLSPKFIYHEIKRFETEFQSNDSTYWLVFELIWRDFFRFSFKKHPIAYYTLQGIASGKSELHATNNQLIVNSWVNGNTQNSFVNAAMKELKATGFVSNRMRQIVASYFIHELQQDWRIGAAYFESQLIDYDVSSNWGNWAYIAGVGNDPQSGRKFNLAKQEEQYDKDKRYQQLWNMI